MQSALNILLGASILSDDAAQIGKVFLCSEGPGHQARLVLEHSYSSSWPPFFTCWYAVLPVDHLLRQHVFSGMCWCVRDSSAGLLAKSRSSSVSKSVHLIPLGWSSVVRHIIQSIARLKRAVDMTHPWCTLVLFGSSGCYLPHCKWSCGRSSWWSGWCAGESHRLSGCAVDSLCGFFMWQKPLNNLR